MGWSQCKAGNVIARAAGPKQSPAKQGIASGKSAPRNDKGMSIYGGTFVPLAAIRSGKTVDNSRITVDKPPCLWKTAHLFDIWPPTRSPTSGGAFWHIPRYDRGRNLWKNPAFLSSFSPQPCPGRETGFNGISAGGPGWRPADGV